MATMKVLDKYWTDDALIFHIAIESEVTRNFGQGDKPTTREYRVSIPRDEVQALTATELRARVIADLQEQRQHVRGTFDPRSNTPNFPGSLNIPDL